VAVAEELAGEPSAVTTGAFDAPGFDLAVPAAPFPEPAQPGRRGGDAAGVEPTTVLVEDDRDVDVFVGVDADGDYRSEFGDRGLCHRGENHLVL
jgi:hypothetical protein